MTVVEPDLRGARRAATQARLLDAAGHLAREHGVAALSLRDLAAAVGMRQPSLYTYFESKHGLYDLMFRSGNEELLARAQAVPATADPRADLRALIAMLFEFALEDIARSDLLFHRSIPGFAPSSESYAPAQQFLGLVTRRLDAVGIRGPEAVDIAVATLAGLLEAQVANDPTGTRWTRHLDRVLDMLITALAVSGGGTT